MLIDGEKIRMAKVLRQLLNCTELNMDDMEDKTIRLISEADCIVSEFESEVSLAYKNLLVNTKK